MNSSTCIASPATNRSATMTAANKRSAEILVIDDEPDALELIQFNLQTAGFHVTTAADVEQALKKARAMLPDLMILDVMLPEVDGLEVCKILRRDPATSGIPIIMVT